MQVLLSILFLVNYALKTDSLPLNLKKEPSIKYSNGIWTIGYGLPSPTEKVSAQAKQYGALKIAASDRLSHRYSFQKRNEGIRNWKQEQDNDGPLAFVERMIHKQERKRTESAEKDSLLENAVTASRGTPVLRKKDELASHGGILLNTRFRAVRRIKKKERFPQTWASLFERDAMNDKLCDEGITFVREPVGGEGEDADEESDGSIRESKNTQQTEEANEISRSVGETYLERKNRKASGSAWRPPKPGREVREQSKNGKSLFSLQI